MPLPVTFATLPTGNNPASLLDQEFAAVAAMGTTYCTATGTNAILLTVAPNQPIPTGYANGQQFSFLAPAANTGSVTIQVGSLAAIPLRSGGAQLAIGALVAGTMCDVIISGGGTGADLIGGGGGTTTINGPVATNRALFGETSNSSRWALLLGNSTPESGSNAGSDLQINRYNDGGSFIDVPLTITRSTGQVAIKGTSTNDAAAAGFVGEVISSVVNAPGVTLTNSVGANVTSISLTSGDWDVNAEVWIGFGTGGGSQALGAISTASATLPGGPSVGQSRFQFFGAFPASWTQINSVKSARMSLASTTTVYLVAQALFPSGTTSAYGVIQARRMR